MSLDAVAEAILARRGRARPYVIGVTGSVASGKSTLARVLSPLLATRGSAPEIIETDGFLLPNAVLAERALELRKGFPETYDLVGLAGVLTGLRSGAVIVPAYSHATYDLDPAAARTVAPADIVLVEGLALGLDRPVPAGATSLIDCLLFIDAAETDLEAWFVARFMGLWEAAAEDPASFYARFRDRDRAGAEALARLVWTSINLPNLREHIAPVRAYADLVVVKAGDHEVSRILAAGA